MLRKTFTLLVSLLFYLSACDTYSPEIYSVCSRDDIGNYILKWETTPSLEGTLKIYASKNPEQFNKTAPVLQPNIQDGIATYITEDNVTRKYFLLSFNDKYYKTIGSRLAWMDSVYNLRDMGGYASSEESKNTRWGKVYRSGKVSSLSEIDTIRMDHLNIKTIIDLRTQEEAVQSPIGYKKANVIHIPVSMGDLGGTLKRIEEERIRKGDALLFMQDLYIQFVTENGKQFGKALEIFLDKENYPILFNCSLGKDRTGFLAALLLVTLGVSEDIIMQDYMTSNDHLDLQRYESMVHQLSSDAQEALTILLSANESYLRLALKKIEKDYGSMSNYLSKELNISEKQQDKLKEILLF